MYVRISTICRQKMNSVEIIYRAGIPIPQDYSILLQRPMGRGNFTHSDLCFEAKWYFEQRLDGWLVLGV